ncbi:MAG: SdpI family protein [Bacillota bacterium]|jgi:uncharacterized membrane protein
MGSEEMTVFLLVMLSIIPATMVIFGLVWRNHWPKTINWLYGYRTGWSTKSQETWDFAHKYIAVLWLRTGIPLWIVSIAAWLIGLRLGHSTLARLTSALTLVQCVCLALPIWPTEAALKRNFDADGRSKTS